MVHTLFVGNLPFAVAEEDLLKLFESFGEIVDVKIIYDREKKRSRGFGFVVFGKESDAKRAAAEMNKKFCLGRSLDVTHSHKNKNSKSPIDVLKRNPN